MLNTKKLLFFLLFTISQNCNGGEVYDLTSLSESASPEEFRAKICAALAVIKCTIYKLESILSNIDVQACCDDNEIIDNCPSLGFDDDDDDNDGSSDCPEQEIDINNAPTTININCDKTNKVKIVLNLNSHQS